MGPQTHRSLIEGAVAALTRVTGLNAHVVEGAVGDAAPGESSEVILETQPPARFTALLRDSVARDNLGALKALGADLPHRPLIVAPHIAPSAAQRARDLDLAFVDLAGNAYLRSSGLFVFVAGRRRVAQGGKKPDRRASTPAGLRVIFNLLTRPELREATYREIAEAAGVALGTVGAVMGDLIQRGLVGLGPGGPRDLLDPGRLAEEWILLYPVRLRPRLKPRRFAARDPGWWRAARIDPQELVIGGEAAGELLTGHLRATEVTLYVARLPEELILRHRLRPDEEGEVEILDAFWPLGAQASGARRTAPPLLVVADLLATGEARNVETARLIESGQG